MFFTEEKLNQRLEELGPYRFRDIHPIEQALICFDREGKNGALPPDTSAPWQRCSQGEKWSERDIYAWLKFSYAVPAQWENQTVVARFDFGLGEQRRDFEALLFINGEPFQGIDQNHDYAVIPQQYVGKTIECSLRIWSGILEGKVRKHFQEFHVGNRFGAAQFAVLDRVTDDFYYTSLSILQTVAILSEHDAWRLQLLSQLDAAWQLVDWRASGSESFYCSVNNAAEQLGKSYEQENKHHPVSVQCVGHTHIDIAYLWQLKHTREKCARSFSTVLRLMERYPEYIFFQSQPQLYEYIKHDYPILYSQIKQRIQEGRWEIDGAMWVEADCNLPSGESFVRQILLGSRFMQEEFGVTPRCLWLPDVFGYSWALPQILKKCGIDYFMTTKISWNEFNRMPHDTFTWRGMDGSEVLAHFITTPEPSRHHYTYNGMINAESVQGIWNNYKDKSLNKEQLLAYGYGDGGGGPTVEMLELLRRFEKMPALPNVKTGRVDDYFSRLDQRLKESREYQHTWDAELYFESHRGTYTSQAQVKRANRRAELQYRCAEWLQVAAALACGNWGEYAQQPLNDGWKIILRNQFHDIIPGSSIAEVYQDASEEYHQAQALVDDVMASGYQTLTQPRHGAVSVLNSASWQRDDVVFIPTDDLHGRWRDEQGEPLAAQVVDDGWLVALHALPALSGTTIYHEQQTENTPCDTPFIIGNRQVETPYYIIHWNEHGHLTRIYDRVNDREVLTDNGNVLTVYEDKPLKYDAWDIEIFYIQKRYPVVQLESVEIIEQGPIRCFIQFKWIYHQSEITQSLKLYSQLPRIDFHTKINWQDYNQLLKVAFPVAIRATEATYDIQFGNVKRPTAWNTSWDYARFESVAHQWVDLSEYNYGVSLLNDCKYGHAVKDNVMQLTLIKSAVSPDAHADRREHEFTYSLLPHAGDWREASVVQQAFALNDPLRATPGEWAPAAGRFMQFDHPFIQIDAIKKAEEGEWVIIRCHEFSGGRHVAKLKTSRPLKWWAECNLLEKIEDRNTVEDNEIVLHFTPYEIKTIALCIS